MKKLGKVALPLALMMSLAACGGGETEAASANETTEFSSLDELYEAAQEEGALTIYGPTEDLYADVYEDFSEEFPGIEIVTADIFGQELDSRLEGELVAGGFEADLVHIGVSDMERFHERGYLQPFTPLGTEELDEAYLGADNAWSVPSQHAYTSAYNSDRLDENEAPKTWQDLVGEGSDWTVATANPKQSGVTPQALSAAYAADVIDDDWLDALENDDDVRIFPSVANALQTTVTGETDVSLVAGYGTFMRQVAQGAPLELAPLEDGVYFSDVAFGLLQDSPSPYSAQLLVSWTFTEAGQASIAEHLYEFGTMPNAPAPEGGEELLEYERVTFPGGESYQEMLARLNEKF